VLSLPPAFVLSQDQTLKFETLCFTLPDDLSAETEQPPGGRCIDELPRFPAKDRSPKPTSVALLKHSQRSFVQAHEPKPKHPNRKAPPPALLFLPSTMSKNQVRNDLGRTDPETRNSRKNTRNPTGSGQSRRLPDKIDKPANP
jgi:hypothetical protein